LGRGSRSRLTDSRHDSGEEKLPELHGETTHRRHQAEERERRCDNISSVKTIRKPCDGNSECRVKNCERRTDEQAQNHVRDQELTLEGLEQNAHDLSIEQIQGITCAQKH
jgi:hypothetical protein